MDLLDGYDIPGGGCTILQDRGGNVPAEANSFERTILSESKAVLTSHRIHDTGLKTHVEESESAGISNPWEFAVVISRSRAFIAFRFLTVPPQVEIALPAGNHVMKLCILMVIGSFDTNLQGITISVRKV